MLVNAVVAASPKCKHFETSLLGVILAMLVNAVVAASPKCKHFETSLLGVLLCGF